ncbi:MAG TPA: glycogen/starch/alpha-glucan phosphorylase [Epulopiscium sp.]|nr:glycogen/starch/alpha-glucan phosphorylase [Candidatus Epulonipiscium sp.]
MKNIGVKFQERFNKAIEKGTDEELYMVLLEIVKEEIKGKEQANGKKKLYYISAEFLIGKLLSNNLINLGIYDQVKSELGKYGKKLSDIEAVELEPSLGNGGLGRLAACFLDSIATLGLNGDGIGLNYHFGLFKQLFVDNQQKETKNPWITKDSWLRKTDISYDVKFGDTHVKSILYEIDVVGYESISNKLRLFDVESIDESIVGTGIDFDKEDIARNLTLFLYPDDSDESGHLLRIYQQYFMVSNAAQLIIEEAVQKGSTLYDLPEYAVIQINDTHPTLIIPEMIYLLGQKGISEEDSIKIVSNMCAYTNHTILAEALEKWPLTYLEKVVPHLIPIIKMLDKRVTEHYKDKEVAIIDAKKRVHMAHIDIHYGYSVNGVAALHTEILKNNELQAFYEIYPEKFNNKTNGITFRRWLLHANNELATYISELIGDGYKKDADLLGNLEDYSNDKTVLNRLLDIKKNNKLVLKEFLLKTQNIDLDENSILDIQIKRLHEYKHQQMNALYVIYKYLDIKAGNKPASPITIIFGAKAAPAYVIAKDIIHLILCLQELVNNDPDVSPYLKLIMIENYNVTAAEALIPACDISEQISLASKEASGTGNMKLMLNGAITLGTMDGANVEICDLVGEENMYTFGASSKEVISHYAKEDYSAWDIYEKDEVIGELVDYIIRPELMKIGNRKSLLRLHNELTRKDWFMTLLDLKDYITVKEGMLKDYENREEWAQKMLINISRAGFFSSDRTIKQYNDDIWHL